MNKILKISAISIFLVLMSISSLKAAVDYIYLFDSKNPSIEDWKNEFYDSFSSNAGIELKQYSEGSIAVIEGTSKKESFGCVYMEVEVNLDKYPVLEIDVDSVSKYWYIIIISDQLKGKEEDAQGNKFIRVQPDVNRKGKSTYNLKSITGLTGTQSFILKVGVATGDVYVPVKEQTMSFNYLRLKGKKKRN